MALVTSGITLKNLICTKLEAQGREVLRPNHVRGGGSRFSPIPWRPGVGGRCLYRLRGSPMGHFSQAMQNVTTLFSDGFIIKFPSDVL